MKYIVYQTTCSVNNKIYIGVHQTKDPNIFDGYLGRGFYKNHTKYIKNPQSPLHYAIIKYGVENFSRKTLFCYDNEEDAYKKEAELVTEKFIQLESNYNVSVGGIYSHRPSRKVYQFDFKGNLIKEYNSALEASKILEVNVSNINDAICHKRTSCKSLWSDSPIINVSEYTITPYNKYYIYDAEGNFVREFDSSSQCVSYLETDTGNLTRAVKLQNRISGFFITTEKLDRLQIVVTKLSGQLNRYDLEGNYIDSFKTIKEAREKLGLKLSSISSAIKLKRQCNGFRWTRGDNPPKLI